MASTPLHHLEPAHRVSYVSNASLTKAAEYKDLQTPEDIEGGALRDGGAPDLFSREYFGVVAQYAAVGLVDAVLPATVYPFLQKYLNANGTTVVTADTLVVLPWSFKVFYGILSDCVPIFGYRRRPYMVLGWAIAIVMLFVMASMGIPDPYWKFPEDRDINPNDPAEADAYAAALARANPKAPTAGNKYVFMMMLTAFGYLMSDVCADGVVVELAQREPLAVRGTTQAVIYGTRTVFNIVGQLVTGFAFNGHEYGGDFGFSLSFPALMLILGCCMIPIIPITWFFIKEEKHEAAVFSTYMRELWTVVQTRAVYQVIFYNFFSGFLAGTTTTASSPVQSELVHVTPINNVVSQIIGQVTYLLGISVTGKYGLHWSWRKIIVITGIAVIALDAMTTFITVWNVYRNQWFWLGLPIVMKLPAGISFLISTFVTVELAKEGQEGAMYGLLTTVSNLSTPFAATLTKIIDRNWDLSNETIRTDTNTVRWHISYTVFIMYATNVLSWAMLYFLPKQKEETQELRRTGGSSKALGILTLVYIGFAFVWSVSTNLMGIFDSTSCLVIAGGDGC